MPINDSNYESTPCELSGTYEPNPLLQLVQIRLIFNAVNDYGMEPREALAQFYGKRG